LNATARGPSARQLAKVAAGLTALLSAGAAVAAPAVYVLDPEHSFVQFELKHFGTSTIRGRFGPARGVVTLDADAGRGDVSIEIPMASADTGFGPFNAHLRGADILAVEAHPTAWFVASRLRFTAPADSAPGTSPQLKTLEGELTLRGVSTSFKLTATRFGCHMHPTFQREVCGGDFQGELLRSDFGIDYGLPFVGNAVTLRVQVEGLRSD